MAVSLNYSRLPQGNPNYQVPAGVIIQFSTNLVQSQIDAGIAAKVTIIHPAFQTRATMFKNRNRRGYHLMASSIDIGKDGKTNFFNLVQFDQDFRDYVVKEFEAFLQESNEEKPAWYLGMMGENTHTSIVTAEESNESLGITGILLNDDLTDNQKEAGIVAKVSIKTNIGDLRSYTVCRSRFGKSLYGVAQSEDDENNIPAYRLSREAEAQVLNFIHSLVTDWGEAPAPRQRQLSARVAVAAGTSTTEETTTPPVEGAVVTNEGDMYNDNN